MKLLCLTLLCLLCVRDVLSQDLCTEVVVPKVNLTNLIANGNTNPEIPANDGGCFPVDGDCSSCVAVQEGDFAIPIEDIVREFQACCQAQTVFNPLVNVELEVCVVRTNIDDFESGIASLCLSETDTFAPTANPTETAPPSSLPSEDESTANKREVATMLLAFGSLLTLHLLL